MTLRLKSTKPAISPSNQDPFTALRAQADQERIRARRGLNNQKDLLPPAQEDLQPGLYSDEMMVDAPEGNIQRKQNRRRGRR